MLVRRKMQFILLVESMVEETRVKLMGEAFQRKGGGGAIKWEDEVRTTSSIFYARLCRAEFAGPRCRSRGVCVILRRILRTIEGLMQLCSTTTCTYGLSLGHLWIFELPRTENGRYFFSRRMQGWTWGELVCRLFRCCHLQPLCH